MLFRKAENCSLLCYYEKLRTALCSVITKSSELLSAVLLRKSENCSLLCYYEKLKTALCCVITPRVAVLAA